MADSDKIIGASFAVASVLAVFAAHTAPLVDVKADRANNENTRKANMSAVLTSVAIVSGIALLAKSPGVFVVGGLVTAIEGIQYAHANMLSKDHGKITTEVESAE